MNKVDSCQYLQSVTHSVKDSASCFTVGFGLKNISQ